MAKQKVIVQDKFGKGLNLFTRETMIGEEETSLASNVWSVGKNSIKKRPGYKQLCEVSGANMVSGLGTYYNGGTRQILIMAGGKLYKDVSGTATQIDTDTWTADLRTDFCQAGNKVYIQNGTNVLREYDGSTVEDTTNGQIGSFLIYYKGYLWTAGDSSDPTRLYRSGTALKLGDFTYNDPDNLAAGSVFVGKNDGQKITGLFKHQDYLYIMKESSLWRATIAVAADGSVTTTLELVDPSRGSVQHHTIDAVENDAFFFNDKGVYALGYEPNMSTQIRTNIVSLRVDPKVKAIQKSRLEETCAIFFDNHYYLAYTSGGGTANDKMLVYDRQRLGWWEFNIGANVFCEYKNTSGYSYLYFGSPTDGKVYYFEETAKSDNGSAISTTWKTGKWSFKDYVQQKFFHHVVLYFGRIRGTVTIKVYIDGTLHVSDTAVLGGSSTYGIGTQTLGTAVLGVEGGETGTAAAELKKIALNKMGMNLQIEITDSQNNKSWELNAVEGIYTPINNMYVKI